VLKRLKEEVLYGPAVFPFAECPNCKQLLEMNATACPRCREEIDPDYALVSAVVVHHNTQACSIANTISGFDAFIPIALIGSILIWGSELLTSNRPRLSLLLLIWPVIPLLAIMAWYARFGRFGIGDDEYLAARRAMRRSFTFWLTLLVVQILLLMVTLD
jgi:hypothetical protein